MAQPVYDPATETDAEHGERARSPTAAPPPVAAPPERSLAWASAVGNNAVQRVARQSVAREAVEEEEPEVEEEPEAAGEDVGDVAAAGPDEELKPEEAEGVEALDELPEDELPE